MFRYVVRRLLQMVLVFFGTTLIVYWLMFAGRSDPIQALVGERPVSPQVREQLAAQYHLNDPFIVQYLNYMKNLLRGNFGTQISGRSIRAILQQAWPYTIKLGLLAAIFVIVLGLAAGIVAGVRRGSIFDTGTLVVTLGVIGIPVFVLGFVAQYLFGVRWKIFPVSVGGKTGLYPYLLPALILGALALGTAIRLTRTSIAENLRADYVRTARSKGLSNKRVVGVHVLRNSLIPVITFFGVTIGDLMAGAVVTERIFNIPGVGYQLYLGINLQDGPTVVTIVSILVIIYLVSNLLVDILYAVLDPRIRYE
jgi:peptide/nickel transport system permease protein/oligopeptide transport system permease protein